MLEEKKCLVENCENSVFHKNGGQKEYCGKHYQQIYKYGKILERTKYDPNKIIDCDDYYEICLYKHNPHAEEIARTKIDKEDLKKVKNYKWYINKKGYVVSTNKHLYIHRLILGNPPNGYNIDHKFGKKLDNRKQNLRFATKSQNGMNRKAKGYHWDKNENKWHAEIMKNYKHINLGYFTDEQVAAKIAEEAKQKYFGEFAYKETN